MAFNFTAILCKGTTNHVPNALLCSPVGEPQIAEMLAEQDEDSKLEMLISQLRTISNEGRQKVCGCRTFTSMQNRTKITNLLKKLSWRDSRITKKALQESCIYVILASSSSPYAERRPYNLNGCHLVIPTRMCKKVLSQLHEARQGAVCTKQWAKFNILVRFGEWYQDQFTSNIKQPIIIKPNPVHPFQEIAADFCVHAGKSTSLQLIITWTGQQWITTSQCHIWSQLKPYD